MKDVAAHAFTIFSVAYVLYLPCDIPGSKVTVILLCYIAFCGSKTIWHIEIYNPHIVKLIV